MQSALLEFLGGEQNVRQSAPRVLPLLQSIEHLGSAPQERTLKNTNDASEKDYVNIDSLVACMQGVHMRMTGCFSKPVSFLVVTGTLYDEKRGHTIDSFNYYFENTTYEAIELLLEGALVKQADQHFLRARATFSWSVDGKKAYECTRVFSPSPEGKDSEILQSVEISAPRAKDKILTQVLYDREQFFTEKIDYHYTDVVSKDRKSTKIKMPFSGKIRVNDGFQILDVMERPEIPVLYLLFENGTYASYENTKGIGAQFVISEDKRELTWEFDVDWQTTQSLERISASTIVNLHAAFTLNLKKDGIPTIFHPQITVNSVEKTQKLTLGAVEIERIQILWGCVAAGTRILMADGSQKPIQQMCIGDRVMTTEHRTAVVEEMVQGREDTLVHIETQNGCTLRVTEHHPIGTIRGFIPAGKLNAADVIRTEQGDSPVKYLYSEQYDNIVYNLCLNPSGAILCEGIWAGDFEMQNRDLCAASKSLPTELQIEMRRLLQERSDVKTSF